MPKALIKLIYLLPKPICLAVVNGLIFFGINLGKRLVGPRILHLTLPSSCDHNCPFCITDIHGKGSLKGRSVLSYEKIIEIIDQSLSDLTLKFNFTSNGEPMLYPQLEKLIIYIKSKSRGNADIQIITNGTSIKEDKIDFYKRNNVSFWLSLHSCEYESWLKVHRPVHSQRLKFDSLLENIKRMNDAGIKLTVHCVVTNLNYSDLDKIPEFIRQNGVKDFSLTRLIDNPELQLSKEQESQLDLTLVSLKNQLNQAGVSHNLDGFEIMLHDAQDSQETNEDSSFYEENKCYINFLMKPVTDEGFIKSCNAGYVLGSVFDRSINDKEKSFRNAGLDIVNQGGLVDGCNCESCPQLVMNKIANKYKLI